MAVHIGVKALIPNPALKPFEAFIGEWQTTGTHPMLPGVELKGRVTFEWHQNGVFVLVHSEIDNPNFPDGVAIFGSDDAAGTFSMQYFDERGISRMYNVSIDGKTLKWWRDDHKLSQRYTITIGPDKLAGVGEMSRNGGEWEGDLSLMYSRTSN